MTIDVNINIQEARRRLSGIIDENQKILDVQVMKDSNFYAPQGEGFLKDSVITASQPGSGVLIWNTPYARRLYYGVDYTFSKDKNPNAQSRWFEAAKAQNLKAWIGIANRRF